MEQAVIIHLPMKGGKFGAPADHEAVIALEERVEKAIADASVGEFDGDEFGGDKCVLFMYGPDADRLFALVEPILKAAPIASGGYAVKRYGAADDPSSKEERVTW
jgi:hypothetical protein